MRRGTHVNYFGPGVAEAANGSGIITALDHSPASRAWLRAQRAKGAFVLGREFIPIQDLCDSAVDSYADRIISLHDPACYDAWQLWNETSQESREQLAVLAMATIRAANRLHAAGISVAIGGFGVGWPRVEDWEAFVPALEVGDYLLLHEYWRDNPTDVYTALRHRLLWERLPERLKTRYQGRVIVGEMGMDWGGGEGDGWKGRISAAQYADQLRRWYGEAGKDTYILGATVFCCGTY